MVLRPPVVDETCLGTPPLDREQCSRADFLDSQRPDFAERVLADVDMNPNFARRVALALLHAADDADATAAAERAKETT